MTRNFWYVESANGDVLNFDDVNLSVAGRIPDLGSVEVEYLTSRGALQDGETVEGYQAETRPLTIPFYYARATTERQYWQNRERLLSFFTPLAAPLRLGVWRSDGENYELRDVYPTPGTAFSNVEAGSYEIQDEISLTAYDPIWWGAEKSLTATPEVASELIYPITYPITYGSDGEYVASFTYAGTWRTYPTITIEGPYSRAEITNSATGARFVLQVEIEASEERVITTDPASGISVTDGNGNSKIGELEIGATLTNFYFERGLNTVSVAFVSASASDTTFTVSYFNRYGGI